MARADATIGDCGTGDSMRISQSDKLVTLPDGTLYGFWIAADSDLYWAKSSDGGFTWSTPTVIFVGSVDAVSVWYDRWSGIDADVIHVAYMENGGDDIRYRALDADTDSLGTEVVVFDGASLAGTQCLSIARARGGNLYVAFDGDSGTEKGFYRSTDAGANWASRSDMTEGADFFLLAPGFAADTQDMLCIFWDRSAAEISRKVYDDSGDSWAETSIAGSMTSPAASNGSPNFSIATDLVNSKVLLVAWSNRDTASATLRFWTVDESTISSPVTIVTSTDDQNCCGLALDTDSGDLYAFYFGKTDGSETIGTSVGVYYKSSTDDGATWSAETTLSSNLGAYDHLVVSPRYDGSAADFSAAFVLNSTRDIFRVSVEYSTGGGGAIFGGVVT